MRFAFLRCVSAVFLAALASAYTQWPGLFGRGGLQPADAFLERARGGQVVAPMDAYLQAPTFAWWAADLGVSVDAVNEGTALVGIAASLVAATVFPHALLLLVTWAAYLSLYIQGQTFLSFQWDILLLEVGALAVCYAPVLVCSGRGAPPLTWTIRLVLFKLMFMAGVVKLQAHCPTWTDLTALNFHYATQCIPNALSWYAHQLPPLVQQFSVLATLYIEIIAPFFILSPFALLRRVAVAQQLLLQCLIVLTGNYNFFSFLTASLCVALLDDERPGTVDADADADLEAVGPALWLRDLIPRLERRRPVRLLLWLVVLLSVAVPAWHWVEVSVVDAPEDSLLERVQLRVPVSPQGLNAFLSAVVPPSLLYAGLLLLFSSLGFLVDEVSAGRVLGVGRAIAALLVTAFVFVANLGPWVGLHQPLRAQLPDSALNAYFATQHWHVVSGYGLFRRMTGMAEGAQPTYGELPLSVVARPEVNLQGTLSPEGDDAWVDIPFRYKPGPVDGVPSWIAPHQARLDWQMWFAALSNYQRDSWIVHLVDKLLEGNDDVIALLDADNYPFADEAPLRIRTDFFHYDFTRWNTTWAARLPNADFDSSVWWTRERKREYLPTVERGNPSIAEFLGSKGWVRGAVAEPLPAPLQAVRDLVRPYPQHHVVWAVLSLLLLPLFPRLLALRSSSSPPSSSSPSSSPSSTSTSTSSAPVQAEEKQPAGLRRRRPKRGSGIKD